MLLPEAEGGPAMSTPGVQKFMTSRVTYFQSNADYKKYHRRSMAFEARNVSSDGAYIAVQINESAAVYLSYRYKNLNDSLQLP